MADVTKLIAEKNVNIIASGCHIVDGLEFDCPNSYIFFCLYGELKESEWDELLREIREVKDNDGNDINAQLTDY